METLKQVYQAYGDLLTLLEKELPAEYESAEENLVTHLVAAMKAILEIIQIDRPAFIYDYPEVKKASRIMDEIEFQKIKEQKFEEFSVCWEIDSILAPNAKEAAKIARNMQIDPTTTANVFRVIDKGGKSQEIDLSGL